MATPLDIAAAALFDNGWTPAPDDKDALAIVGAVLGSLTDDRVVAYLTNALYRLGWGAIGDGTLEDMVRDAMRELGEA